MGFTRYWIRPKELEAERFALFSVACRDACADLDECLCNPIFTNEQVSFLGIPNWEPFIVNRVSTGRVREDGVFEFCKTQKLPYDEAVRRCIDLLKEFFPGVEVPEPS